MAGRIIMKKTFFYCLAVVMILLLAGDLMAEQSAQATRLNISVKGSTVLLEASGPETAVIEVAAYASKGGSRTGEALAVTLRVNSESAQLPPVELMKSVSSSYRLTLPKGHSYFITAIPPYDIIKGKEGNDILRWGEPQTKEVQDLTDNTSLVFYFEDADATS